MSLYKASLEAALQTLREPSRSLATHLLHLSKKPISKAELVRRFKQHILEKQGNRDAN